MAFFSDILKKIKKPVDALKDFLTPKERSSLQEKEKSSPMQRIETKLPSFEYKPPSFEGLKSFASSFIPPKEAFKPIELAPRETLEERAARLEKARETTKKIADFGKAVLRAGPRAAASVTLEAQGRRTMIPETRAEKFLFGQEPLESLTERVERFPERAKEFGIQEPTAKKIAPFAVLGLTALDILPPLPGKSGLKAVAKKALTTKTAKEFAKAITKKEADQILKAGFKSVDDFFQVTKSPSAKTSTKIVNELKAAASGKPTTPGIPKELESLAPEARKANLRVTQKGDEYFLTGTDSAGRSVKTRGTKEFVEQEMTRARGISQAIPKELETFIPKAQKHGNVNAFIREIADDTYAPEFRNPIADFWRKKYVQPLSKGSKATFSTDVVAFERNLDDVLKSKYGKDQLANMSVRQKSEIVNGKNWTNLYADMLDNNLFKFQQDFFKAAKSATPASPTAALKETAGKTIHAKKLESGIDEAYRALEKTGKDEVYNLGKVGDYIADPKVREQYKDVLDTPLYIKKQMHMGKTHGSLSVDPKGKPAIVLSDGLTKDMIDRTLVEELTHASQFKKGVRPTKGVPYKEIPEEIRAKKAAKHFAPKTTLEDLMEEAGLHRAKAKQFSNNDLEKEFVARQMGVAEGIEKAVDELKRATPAKARPTEIIKEALKSRHADPFELAKKPDYAKELRTSIGSKETILAHQDEFYARPERMKEGVFYHFTPDKKLTAEGLVSGAAKRFDKQLGPGLYVGQDAQSLKNFYGLDIRGGQAIRIEGSPKILDLTDSYKSIDDAYKAAKKEFPKEKYPLGKWVQKQGYDGIKYFDPIATGEEYVVYSAQAFGIKTSEALKAVRNPNYKKAFDDAIKKGMTPPEAANYAIKNVVSGDIAPELRQLGQKARSAKNIDEFLKAEHPAFPAKKEFAFEQEKGISYITKNTKPHGAISVDSPLLVPSEGIAGEVIDKVQVGRVKAQIAKGEKIAPIAVRYSKDKQGYFLEVVDGHHRLTAAQEAGIKEIPFVFDTKRSFTDFYNHAVGGKPSEVLKAAVPKVSKEPQLLSQDLPFVKSLFKDTAERGIKTKEGFVFRGGNIDEHIADIRQKLTKRGYKETGGISLLDEGSKLVKDGAELNFEKQGGKAINVYMRTDGKRTVATFDETPMDFGGKLHTGENYVPEEIKNIYDQYKPAIRKELDKTFENIPDFVKKRYPNAEAGRRVLEEGYERGLALSKQAGDIKPNTLVTSYHGTTRTSAEAIKKSGFKVPEAETFAESGGRKYGEGVYLQPAKEDAITSSLFYGKRADPKGMGADLAVLETEFIPKKPFVISSPQKFMPFGSNEWGGFIHKILKEPTINDSITAYLKNRPARLKVDIALRKAGYDSVILKAEGKADLVVALNPSDVKITNIYKDADGSLETFRKGYQKAFRDSTSKPVSAIEELKTAAKADIPKIKGATAIDLSQPAKAAQPSKVQEIISEYQKRINTTPAKKASTPIKKTLDETYTAIIDRFHPITKLARKATDLRPGENPELLSRRYLGVQGIAESKLFWNTTRLTAEGNLEVTGPGLSKILKPAKDNIDDLRTLMIAERDIELSKRTLESGKKVIGTTPQKSKEVMSALKGKYGEKGFEQLTETAQGVREWSRKALLDPLLEVGAISKEQYDTIGKSNKFYVPFQRVIEELETQGFVPKKANIFSPRSVPVKKLKGSTKDIIDPFESMITNAYKVTDFAERARVGRSIVNLRNTSPELAEMIKPIKPKLVPVAKQGEELIFRPSFFAPDKNTMMVFENGKRKFYQVPEDVFKAVSGMMESDVGAIMKVLAFPARTLRAGATLTPEFMGRNPLRDQLTAFVFSKYGYVPGVDLAKGIFNTVGKTDLHGRWLAGGGAHSMLVSLDRVTSQATLAKVLGAKDIKGMVKNPIEALRMLSEFGEKGTRVGAFGRAVKKGVSDLEAAFESRDITLDFARRGSQTRAVNMLVAFWNAQVQGLNKLVRAFRERPMQTTFKAASGVTLPSVLLYLNNRNDPRYQELPQWQKDLFWIIPIGDDGPIIRIPKPFEIGIIFGTVPEHILTWIDKNDPEALTSAAKTLMEASAPGYIPTGLQPIIENVANYSFFRQRPIVSEGKQALPKELQADRYTSETAKEVGKLIKQSPAKIENLFVSYTGGLGKYALDASDKLLKTLGVVSPPSEPAKTLSDRPFLRAFVAREPIGSGSESVNKFYKLYDEANATKAAVKGLAEEGKEQEAINYLRSRPAGFYTKGLNKVARTFSDLRKKRDAVLDSRDLNPEQKKRAIDALDRIMTEIARQTVELVKTSNEKLGQ